MSKGPLECLGSFFKNTDSLGPTSKGSELIILRGTLASVFCLRIPGDSIIATKKNHSNIQHELPCYFPAVPGNVFRHTLK